MSLDDSIRVPSRDHEGEEIKPAVINNEVVVRPDESIQEAIDTVADGGSGEFSGLVRFEPGIAPNSAGWKYENDTLPIVVKPGVVLDMRRTYHALPSTASDLYDLRGQSKVLAHGAVLFNDSLTGSIFTLDADVTHNPGTNKSVHVFGFPTVKGGAARSIYHLKQSGGGTVYGSYLTADGWNTSTLLRIDNDGTGNINNNTVEATGSFSPGTGSSFLEIFGTNNVVRSNYVHGIQVQIKSGDHVVHMTRGTRNYIYGEFADPKNVSGSAYLFEAGCRRHNVVTNGYGSYSSEFDNQSGDLQILRTPYNHGMVPQNLSGLDAPHIGFTATDDGTNTAAAGIPCTWVDTGTDGVGDAWQPHDGSATFI